MRKVYPRRWYPAPPDEIRHCIICGKPFTCHPHEWPESFRKRQTCGVQCGKILQARRMIQYPERWCPSCYTLFKPRDKDHIFCSRACFSISKRGQPASYIPPRIARVTLACPQCGKIHEKREKEARRKFCSRVCWRLFHREQGLGKRYPFVVTNDFYLSAAWSRLKRAIKKRDHYTCQACLFVFHPKAPGMVVHHIRPRELFHTEGIALHPLADAPANLVMLCRSCHQKTHAGYYPQFLDMGTYQVQQLGLFNS